MKNNLNKKLIGLMAVGITAGLMVCPVHVSANENDPESLGEIDPDSLLSGGNDDTLNNGSSEDDIGAPTPDDGTSLDNTGDNSSNDGSSGDGTGDASSNDGSSGDNTGDASSSEDPAVVDTGDHVADLIDSAEESALAAETGFGNASDQADQAIQDPLSLRVKLL
ncbi:MAG: hypothetical protein K6E91_00310 [Butyrivibrio sp.]|nr:hypothetical protein [Butyrivibrio sp.]